VIIDTNLTGNLQNELPGLWVDTWLCVHRDHQICTRQLLFCQYSCRVVYNPNVYYLYQILVNVLFTFHIEKCPLWIMCWTY